MNGITGVAGVNAQATGQQQQTGQPSAAEQEELFSTLMVQAAVPLAALNFAQLRSIMSQAAKPPQ